MASICDDIKDGSGLLRNQDGGNTNSDNESLHSRLSSMASICDDIKDGSGLLRNQDGGNTNSDNESIHSRLSSMASICDDIKDGSGLLHNQDGGNTNSDNESLHSRLSSMASICDDIKDGSVSYTKDKVGGHNVTDGNSYGYGETVKETNPDSNSCILSSPHENVKDAADSCSNDDDVCHAIDDADAADERRNCSSISKVNDTDINPVHSRRTNSDDYDIANGTAFIGCDDDAHNHECVDETSTQGVVDSDSLHSVRRGSIIDNHTDCKYDDQINGKLSSDDADSLYSHSSIGASKTIRVDNISEHFRRKPKLKPQRAIDYSDNKKQNDKRISGNDDSENSCSSNDKKDERQSAKKEFDKTCGDKNEWKPYLSKPFPGSEISSTKPIPDTTLKDEKASSKSAENVFNGTETTGVVTEGDRTQIDKESVDFTDKKVTSQNERPTREKSVDEEIIDVQEVKDNEEGTNGGANRLDPLDEKHGGPDSSPVNSNNRNLEGIRAHSDDTKIYGKRSINEDVCLGQNRSGFLDDAKPFDGRQTLAHKQDEYAENIDDESIYATSDNEFIGKLSRFAKAFRSSECQEMGAKKLHQNEAGRSIRRGAPVFPHEQKYRTSKVEGYDEHLGRKAREKITDLKDHLHERNHPGSMSKEKDVSRVPGSRVTRLRNLATTTEHQSQSAFDDVAECNKSSSVQNEKFLEKSSCYYRKNREQENKFMEGLDDAGERSPSIVTEKSYKVYSGNFDDDEFVMPNISEQEVDEQMYYDSEFDLMERLPSDEDLQENGSLAMEYTSPRASFENYHSHIERNEPVQVNPNSWKERIRDEDTRAPWSDKRASITAWVPPVVETRSSHEQDDLTQHKEGNIQVTTFPLSHPGPGIVVESNSGIIIKEIVKGRDAFQDGRLAPGDRLLSINEYNLSIASLAQAKSVLRKLQEDPSERFATVRFLRYSDSRHAENDDYMDADSTLGQSMTLPSILDETTSPLGSPGKDAYLHILREELALPFQPPPLITSTPVAPNMLSPSKGTCWICAVNKAPRSTDTRPSMDGQHLHDDMLLIAPDSKIHLSKLESSLCYLGLDLTECQKFILRNRLQVDSQGYVVYDEFARCAGCIYEAKFSRGYQRRTLRSPERLSTVEFSSRTPASPLPDIIPQIHIDSLTSRKMDNLLADKDLIKDQIFTIKNSIKKRGNQLSSIENELKEVRHDLERAKQRRQMLLKRNAELERSRGRTTSKVKNYESAISSLEREIKNLKASKVPITSRAVSKCAAVEKQIRDLVRRLRIVERSNTNYHTATQKLIAFAHKVQRVVSEERVKRVEWYNSQSSSDHTYQVVDPQASSASHPHKGIRKVGRKDQYLSSEARRIIGAVEGILAHEPLPYGWEEAYTERGARFYIDHVTGITTWVNPLAKRKSARPRKR
ncbi:hypothetical protein QZH41_004044 [Actinostola sp. cb2023]|nr:hypothetical protein QZH41_004044 [Actinostola sp. cb2023]